MNHLKKQILNCFCFSDDSQIIRIKVDGRFVTVNGKSVWHGIGAAKKALRYWSRNRIVDIVAEDNGVKKYTREYRAKEDEFYNLFLEWALNDGFIEFVALENEKNS